MHARVQPPNRDRGPLARAIALRVGLALAAVLPWVGALPASARPPACRGTLSGAVKAEFACDASVVTRGGARYFVVDVKGPIEGVPGCAPGAFEIPGELEARTYSLESLGMGRASVAAEGGTLYTASKTSGVRGEVTIALESVKESPGAPGVYSVHGTYRARLVPAGSGKSGEVVIEVAF